MDRSQVLSLLILLILSPLAVGQEVPILSPLAVGQEVPILSPLAVGQEVPLAHNHSLCAIASDDLHELGILEDNLCKGYQSSSYQYYHLSSEFLENLLWVLPSQASAPGENNGYLIQAVNSAENSDNKRLCLAKDESGKLFLGLEQTTGVCRNAYSHSRKYTLAKVRNNSGAISEFALASSPALSPSGYRYIGLTTVAVLAAVLAAVTVTGIIEDLTGLDLFSLPFLMFHGAKIVLSDPENMRKIWLALNHILHRRVQINGS